MAIKDVVNKLEKAAEDHNRVDGVCEQCGNDVIASGYCGADVTWKLYADGLLKLEGTGTMADGAPWYDHRSQITAVEISDGVTSIGFAAFKDCANLASITIPNSVKYIRDEAFCGCTSLTSITIPDSVIGMDFDIFTDCISETDNLTPSFSNSAFLSTTAETSAEIFGKYTSTFSRLHISNTISQYLLSDMLGTV